MLNFISIPGYYDSLVQRRLRNNTDVSLASKQSELRQSLFRWGVIAILPFCVALWRALFSVEGQSQSAMPSAAYAWSLCLVPAFACAIVNFTASLVYLVRRTPKADALANSAAQVALICLGTALALGTLSEHRQLNLWWNWSACSAISIFVALLYTGYRMVRKFCDPGRVQLVASVVSIFAFLDVPFICVAARLRLAGSVGFSQLLSVPSLADLCRPPDLWNALACLALAAVAVAAQHQVLVVHQLIEEEEVERRS
jgi:ABC-type transport system involved in cytochrome c biogenesis permease subunit